MSDPHTSQPWDLISAIDLHHRLSTSSTSTLNHELLNLAYCPPKDEPSTTDRCASSALGDFTPIWNYLGVDANTTGQEFDAEPYESTPSSFASGGDFSGLDNLPSSATDDSDTTDIFEAYVTKSKEVRWKDQVHATKLPKLKRRSTRDLEKDSEDLLLFSEKESGGEASPPKKVDSSPFAGDRLFHLQSPKLQRKQTRRQELSRSSQTDESSGLESEVETPSRSKSARLFNPRLFNHVPVVDINNDFDPGTIYPLHNLTLEEKRTKIAKKLSDQLGINRNTLLNTTINLQSSADPEAIHVFVDCSNIMIGFNQALRIARAIPEKVQMKKTPPFSYRSLAFIMERNRPAARRILVGSKLSHYTDTELPTHFAEAQECGYETNILERVWKAREMTPKKALRGRGNGYLTGQSSGSETPYTNMSVKANVEQGVDEILHMKLLETLLDFQKPSTIVLATGDGAEAEYSAGFFTNVEKALLRGWKVEIVAWKNGLSHLYRSKSFLQRWRKQFDIILLDDFSEELLAIYTKHGTPPERLAMQSPLKTKKPTETDLFRILRS